jgi:hypothetical protein
VILGEPTSLDYFRETLNVLSEKDWIMQELFVALIAKDSGLIVLTPWANLEYAVRLCSSSVC